MNKYTVTITIKTKAGTICTTTVDYYLENMTEVLKRLTTSPPPQGVHKGEIMTKFYISMIKKDPVQNVICETPV